MPFKEGYDENRNYKGRPEGSISVVSALKRELEKVPEGEKKKNLQLLVEKIIKKGIKEGDVAMIKDIINRVDGMPKQSMDVTSGGETLGIVYLPKKNERLETSNKTENSISEE